MGGGEGERGCIHSEVTEPKQGNEDLMNEEGATLSIMCNTHTAHTIQCHSLVNHTTAHLPPTLATLVPTSPTHTHSEMAAVYRTWV